MTDISSQSYKMIRSYPLLNMLGCLFLSSCGSIRESGSKTPLKIQDQGSFAAGGTVISEPGKFDPYQPTAAGQTFRGDHAYAFYQIPVNARKQPFRTCLSG